MDSSIAYIDESIPKQLNNVNWGQMMLDFINPSHPSEFAVLRLVAEAQEGGGDVFDIGRLCKNLVRGDNVAWEQAWLGLAEATEAKAKRELELGHAIHADMTLVVR